MVIEEDKHDLFIYFNIKQTKNTIWIKNCNTRKRLC